MTRSLAACLEDALKQAAGPEAAPVSLTIDHVTAPAVQGEAAHTARGWVERATRSLIFVQAEAVGPDGVMAGAASAVFRRVNV